MTKLILIILFLNYFTFSNEYEIVETATMGTDFWVSFPPNSHIGMNDLSIEIRDSIFLFMGANEETDVRFTYWDYEGNEYSKTITIADPSKYETFGIAWWDFEMPAQDRYGHRWKNDREYIQEPSKLSIHVDSDKPIILLGHSQALYSSDGMLVYPTPVLGNNYILACYNSIQESRSVHRASHFSIVATEDNTEITINPKEELSVTGLDEVNITLNKGEVYYARAKELSGFEDLTGTEIISNKKIAVFSGVERTNIPNSSNYGRDYLITQLSPLETAGIEYLITPFFNNSYKTQDEEFHSLFRLISYYDDTEVYINDEYFTTLNKGDFFEKDIEEAYHIKTSKTTYAYSIRRSGVNDFTTEEAGDPFLLINPPLQHFHNAFKAINFDYNEIFIQESVYFNDENQEYYTVYDTTYNQVYTEHYMTIVLKESAIDKTELDFNPLPNNLTYTKIHNTDFVYTHIKVSSGTHYVKSNDMLLCYSYGYGYANSYGSIAGGLNVKILDHHPPQIRKQKNCANYEISFSDINFSDTGLDSIMIVQKDNIIISDNFNGDSLDFADAVFSLEDPYQDGFIIYKVYDKFGLYTKDTIEIPGFTLTQEISIPNIDNRGHKSIEDLEFNILITNYGKFVQDLIITLPEYMMVINNKPDVVNPNQTINITLKIEKEYLKLYDIIDLTSILEHLCFQEKYLQNSINIWYDKNEPTYQSEYFDDCNKIYEILNINESDELDFGINELEVLNIVNIDFTIDKNQYNAAIDLSLIDIFKNGYYTVNVKDYAGNTTEINGSIGGLDLYIQEGLNSLFGEIYDNTYSCDTVEIYNGSEREFIFEYESFQENINYSIPISQFPIIIPPKTEYPLIVCFESNMEYNFNDILKLQLNECFSLDIELISILNKKPKKLNSNCELIISINKSKSEHFNLSLPYPNPVKENININLNNDKERNISFILLNTLGNEVFTYESIYSKAYYNMSFNLKDIPSGNYILLINSNDIKEQHKISIIK